jgi:transposase
MFLGGVSPKEIWKTCWLSRSSLRRILKKVDVAGRLLQNRARELPSRLTSVPAVVQCVEEFCKSRTTPITSTDIRVHLHERLNVDLPPHCILKILKSKLNLSWKRSSSRPQSLDFEKVEMLKSYFSVKFLKWIDHLELLANVDESSFNRNTKENYTWSTRGKASRTGNIMFRGSISVITTILSNGKNFSQVMRCNVNSEVFLNYCSDLVDFLKANSGWAMNKIGLILDNWSYHRSKSVRRYLGETGLNIYFLPAYSPDLAPVELFFGWAKKNALRIKEQGTVDLSKPEGKEVVENSIQLISEETVINFWRHFISQIKQKINETKEIGKPRQSD